MKKKVFFILSSLGAGGSERVFWLLSQGFDKNVYETYIVHLGSDVTAFSTDLEGVTVINLKTVRASRSFRKLHQLIKKEQPHAVFSTGANMNILVALISMLNKIPCKIAREANVYKEMASIRRSNSLLLKVLIGLSYRVFDHIVCQSIEIKNSFIKSFRFPAKRLIIIANPVLNSTFQRRIKNNDGINKILIVARLEPEKAHFRLLDIMKKLPENFHLTIAGEGSCYSEINQQINRLDIGHRVVMLGKVNYVDQLIISHDVSVLTSLSEGFPNTLLESIARGTPVISYKVSGISDLVLPGFNGYIIDQGDELGFVTHLQRACLRKWNHDEMIEDIQDRFSLEKIAKSYQNLIA